MAKPRQWQTFFTGGVAAGVILATAVLLPLNAAAATQNLTPTARVSFTFDDSLASAYTTAAPTLQKYGFVGTDYVITGCVGMTQAPNTCHANNDAVYMSWAQVTGLKNTYGWEIGSHTVTHPYLASFDASDGQPNALTQAQVIQELTQSKTDLANHGITATDFATPYGDYTPATLTQIAKIYASHRGFADVGYNGYPYNDYLLYDEQVQGGVSVSKVESYINTAIQNKSWLVLTFHDILARASTNPDDYQYSTANLNTIAAYVKTKGVQVTTIDGGLLKSDTNLLPNGTFNDGLADGWTTDAPSTITADSGNNGSYPDATKSIKLTSTSANTHLFSPKVAATPGKTYVFKTFLNVAALKSGEVAFYIDEYDKNGNWVSGQYRVAERSVWLEDLNFTYVPTSANVAQVSLQTIVTGNPGITAYLDNVQMLPTN
jgi:peptidoglycan/xylan/chitin deacetylase (PgdA/CDA1 family)